MRSVTILNIVINPCIPLVKDILNRPDQYSVFSLNAMTNSLLIYPDFILSDFNPDDDKAIFRVRRISKHFPLAKIIIITKIHPATWVKPLLKEGVTGFLCSEAGFQEWEECLHTISKENRYFSPSIRESMLNTLMERNNQHTRAVRLSGNEKKVAVLLKKGESISGIANLLSLHTDQVARLYTNIIRKLKIQPAITVYEYLNQPQIYPDLL